MRNNEVVTRKEYIERKAAKEKLCGMCRWEGTTNCEECEHPIDAIPAADVVPVVRCGECKHWFDNGTDLCSCDRDALLRRRDFFCADGALMDKDGDGE